MTTRGEETAWQDGYSARRSSARRWAVSVLLTAWLAVPALAQRPSIPLDSAKLGAMVRVRTTEREHRGALVSRTALVIEIKPGFDIKTARTPDTTFAVIRAELVEGAVRTGSRWKTGALIGTIGLGIAGGVLGCLYSCSDPEIDSDVVPYGAAAGALAGAILGAGLGHFIKVWTPLSGLRLGAGMTP